MNDNKWLSRAGKNFNNVLDECPDIEAKSRLNQRSTVWMIYGEKNGVKHFCAYFNLFCDFIVLEKEKRFTYENNLSYFVFFIFHFFFFILIDEFHLSKKTNIIFF